MPNESDVRHETSEDQKPNPNPDFEAIGKLLTPGLAVIAVIVSIASLFASIGLAREANSISSQALELANTSAEQGIARRVYIGEVPSDFRILDSETHVSVINSNSIAVYDVVVEGDLGGEPAIINIWTIQSCTGYTLPAGFSPELIRFFDGTRAWTRQNDGALMEAEVRHSLETPGAADPPRTFESVGCA